MASEIQVTRGSLHAKGPENLLRGELFWVPTNTSNDATNNYRKDTRFPYDRGTLYIGRPSLSDSNTYESPIPIAGERAYKGLVFRGFITTQTSISDELFKFVREGDFYIFNNDPNDGDFKNVDNFVQGDMLIITNADYDIAPDLLENQGQAKNVEYIRFNGSGGLAKYTKYETTNNTEITNVADALDDLYSRKIEYRGRIEEDYSYAELMTYQASNVSKLDDGAMYHVTKDGLKFTGHNIDGTEHTWTAQKGDFVIWQSDIKGWLLVPSGYTDAEEIDFDPTEAVEQQTAFGTFNEDNGEHIATTSTLNNVQKTLTYLLSHKAMLDSNGKVPLSQLHSTVMGGMQYMGTWNPINDAQGVNNPAYQNDWPSGRSNAEIEGAEESSGSGTASKRGNKNGDYYIVKCNPVVKNVQYYDKDSIAIGDLYSRCEELNSGDWIVYQVDPDTGVASWQIIDNSDSITSLNFHINGTNESGEADYAENTTTVSIVGNPTMAASDKLVLWQQDNQINIAGVRLVDQALSDPNRKAEDTYLPVYTGNTDTLMRSTIRNYNDAKYGGYVTKTNSNLIIGDNSTNFNEYIYGDIYLRPKLVVKDGVNVNENTAIKFQVITEQGSSIYNDSTLRPDDNQKDNTDIILPDDSSKILGKLKGVTFIRNRITKVHATDDSNTGYIDNSSIEEHMYSSNAGYYQDIDVASVEFHAPIIDVNNIETRHITLGQKINLNPDMANGGSFSEDGRFLDEEIITEIFANPAQTQSDIKVYTPLTTGVLINDVDIKREIQGDEGTLPIYGAPELLAGESTARRTLINSKIKQVSNSLFEALFNSESDIGNDTRELGEKANVDSADYFNDTDKDFVMKKYGAVSIDADGNKTFLNTGTPDNVNIDVDTIIGETAQSETGAYIKTPRSLMVTKSLILGNKDTNSVHFVPGRTLFPNSSQYRYAKNEAPIPVKDVYLEMPAVSGVILTNNSRVDGGFFTD